VTAPPNSENILMRISLIQYLFFMICLYCFGQEGRSAYGRLFRKRKTAMQA
jgi:hypothetical protein